MILVDANLLIYASVDTLPQHAQARTWFDARLNGASPVGLPWSSLLAFVRLTTNARMFEHPATIAHAWQQVTTWLACDNVWIPAPQERHQEILGALLLAPGTHANLVPDAHLAAIAIEHSLILCSADTDFARFPGLRWENPLVNPAQA